MPPPACLPLSWTPAFAGVTAGGAVVVRKESGHSSVRPAEVRHSPARPSSEPSFPGLTGESSMTVILRPDRRIHATPCVPAPFLDTRFRGCDGRGGRRCPKRARSVFGAAGRGPSFPGSTFKRAVIPRLDRGLQHDRRSPAFPGGTPDFCVPPADNCPLDPITS